MTYDSYLGRYESCNLLVIYNRDDTQVQYLIGTGLNQELENLQDLPDRKSIKTNYILKRCLYRYRISGKSTKSVGFMRRLLTFILDYFANYRN